MINVRSTGGRTERKLPNRLSGIADVGAKISLVAVGLILFAFLTDPTPTKDLPGIGLPVTLPVSQPDVGHSVASYFVGMWVWEFTFPLLILAVYDRWTDARQVDTHLLIGLPAVYMTGLLLYCGSVYVPLVSPEPLGPAATAVCWAFCATGASLWGVITAVVAALGLVSWIGATRGWASRGWLAVGFGLLSLPLGIPTIYWGYTMLRNTSGGGHPEGVGEPTAAQ